MQLSPLSLMINLITSWHFYHIPGYNREDIIWSYLFNVPSSGSNAPAGC